MLYFQDILENEDVKLDNMFIASLVGDILRVSMFTNININLVLIALKINGVIVNTRR